MVVIQANKLTLPPPHQSPSTSSSSPPNTNITSFLFEPTSQSLALMHSDSSSLYASLSPLSPTPPKSITHIPPPISSSSFLLLNPNDPRVLFVVSGPHKGGSSILLRFYIFQKSTQIFTKAQVVCDQKDLKFHEKLSGVIVSVSHGVSVKLSGSINVLAMHSVSSNKIWLFSVKMVDGDVVKLIKCSVIECSVPVWSIGVSFGYLMLGEENGVRVFTLRPLVKGREKKDRRDDRKVNGRLVNYEKLVGKGLNLPNGFIGSVNGSGEVSSGLGKNEGTDRLLETAVDSSSNDHSKGKIDTRYALADSALRRAVKLRSEKLKQDSATCFAAFSNARTESSKSTLLMSAKAISIQALSPNKFFILDSVGNLYLLGLSNVVGSKLSSHMRKLSHVMKVRKLAVFGDISTRAQTAWISDGNYSLHLLTISDLDSTTSENDKHDSEEKLMLSVDQVIFTSEKIQDIVPLSANAIAVLGQGNIFAYAIS